MAYGCDLKTGLPPGGRPVLRLHIFDIFDIFNIFDIFDIFDIYDIIN
jgi:hypothetical protein